MKKTAIFYHSSHHDNTKKLVSGIEGVEAFPVNQAGEAALSQYRLIGLASGVYMGKPHASLLELAGKIAQDSRGNPPEIFAVCTSGSGGKGYARRFQAQLEELGLPVVGAFSCRGFDTFGPWKLVGGIRKGRPNDHDLKMAEQFILRMAQEAR